MGEFLESGLETLGCMGGKSQNVGWGMIRNVYGGGPKKCVRDLRMCGSRLRMHRRESLECRGKDLRRVE